MLQRKFRKILVYFFLFILISSIGNIKINSFQFDKIKNINVSGLNEIENINLINKIKKLNIENIFFLNGKEISALIDSNNSIESFIITKKYPSTIEVKIVRTNFLAKVNNNGKILYIGSNGKLSNHTFSENNLPFIFGKLDIQEFLNFKKLIDQSKFTLQEIKNFYFYPSERWDIEFKNNMILKLSKNNPKLSLDNAFEILNNKNIKNFNIIDARIENQIILND